MRIFAKTSYMVKCTSLDILRLITWIAYYKNNVILNKTQVQKILYICYGLSLAKSRTPLFEDDTPKAWPFGPVFPITYRRYIEHYPAPITEEEKKKFGEIPIINDIFKVVNRYCHYTSKSLSEWSHQIGGPWWQEVYKDGTGAKWNNQIPNDSICKFFEGEWNKGL